jgi:hypothetical protein
MPKKNNTRLKGVLHPREKHLTPGIPPLNAQATRLHHAVTENRRRGGRSRGSISNGVEAKQKYHTKPTPSFVFNKS